MRNIILILSFFLASCTKAQNKIEILIGSQNYHVTVSSIAIDDGYYNAFSFPEQENGIIYAPYKKSAGHAPKGPMTMLKSTNGGASWSEWQITVGATPIECAALSFIILDNGRFVIAYQDDELYTSVKFAYSDDKGVTWTASSTHSFGANHSASPSPVKMRQMPSGKIMFGYYDWDLTLGTAEIGFLTSSDDGATFSQGPVIFNHAGTGIGDDKGHEFAFIITDNTGVDATCKMIAVVRNADTGPYMHYKSADGGTTWTTDMTEDAGVGGPYSRHYVYKWWGNQQPLDLAIHNELVYMICGERNTNVPLYRVGISTATPSDAYTNLHAGWSTVEYLSGGESTYGGGDIDFGYPVMFHDWQGKLWCQFYDVSTEPRNPSLTEDRCWVKQIKVSN